MTTKMNIDPDDAQPSDEHQPQDPVATTTSPPAYAAGGFSLDDFAPIDADVTPAQRTQTHVPVEKVKKSVFMRVHPLHTQTCYAMKDEDDRLLLVASSVAAHGDLAEHIGLYVLYSTIDRQGNLRIWPVRRARPTEASFAAWDSAHAIAERAKTKWLRMQWNKAISAYDCFIAPVQPVDPEWPDFNFGDLVKQGFEGRVVSSLDHPAIRRLLGRE
jgi:hypothetical protein